MTDVAAKDGLLSETKGCSGESLCHVTSDEGDSAGLTCSETASLAFPKDNEDGEVGGLHSATMIGQKRGKELEPMDHSGTRMHLSRTRNYPPPPPTPTTIST